MHSVIVLVEPETGVLWAIKENLMRQFQREFKIYSADSDPAALEKLKQLQQCNDSLALFVVKQQNSPITGVEFLQLVMETFPTAKRLLLNLYDDDDIPARIPLLQTLEI
ncbi:response regulator [Aliterella atlantica]|uniref:Response regulatory domain-containing protein n=1 Tax=Aliterella atlantica CENA595 TaxID=1618023 RepID=A0A0D8ZPS1_9CYAN|nr:hypothetical protein [Aliterella atlantica]KJH70347.1 hypothetical protein UH38_18765 [Aliterella atlantica CENA595]